MNDKPSKEEIERVDRLIEHLRTRPFIASIDEGDDIDDGDETVETDITLLGRKDSK